MDKVIIFYKINLNDNLENKSQKNIFGFYQYFIELKSILKKENIFDCLFDSYKQHVEKYCIKNIIQSKYNIYIYEEFKKGTLKKLGLDEIPINIINLYEDNRKK